jgi:hypothetical protein
MNLENEGCLGLNRFMNCIDFRNKCDEVRE